LIRPASDFLSNIELVGCALSSLWSAAPSSALLSTAPGILGSLSEPAKASAEPHLVHTASMVDLFHDAACVRTFLIQSDHSVAWLTDNNEIWIQARPGYKLNCNLLFLFLFLFLCFNLSILFFFNVVRHRHCWLMITC
jgi:hypothetical protein